MSLKKPLAYFLVGTFFLISIAGCGSGSDDSSPVETVSQPSNSSSSTSSSNNPGGIDPDIHINVPPPVDEKTAKTFFDNKEEFDGFSEELQARARETLENLPPPGEGGPGSTVYHTLMGGTTPKSAEFVNCDPSSEFICIDAPQPPEGSSDIYTISAGIDLIVRLDLNQLAVFGASDPVAVVSVFNNDSGGASTEILIMPEDVEAVGDSCTDESCVGRFETAIPLGGAGKFTVVVSAYRVINDGEGNDLYSKMFTVYRTEMPEMEIIEARPVTIGTETIVGEPVDENSVISSERLRIKVKLLTTFSPGVQIRFENYDETGSLRSFDAVGYVANKQAVSEGGEMVYTGEVILHQDLNNIRIIGANPEMDKIFGDEAPPPQVLEFNIYNYYGAPKIKIISPKPGTVLIPQNPDILGQKVKIEFCYTLVPELIPTGSGSNPPDIDDDCVTGQLGFEASLFLNGRKVGAEDDPKEDSFSANTTQGIFTAQVTPDFGVNIFQIVSRKSGAENDLGVDSGSFIFGVPVTLIEDGVIQNSNTFSKRGLNIDIDQSLLQGDVTTMIQKFLARPETGELLLGLFKSTAAKPGYVCEEYVDPNTGKPVGSNGDTSIEFLTDTFTLGPIQLNSLATGTDGLLHVGVSINGMHGEADLKPVNPTGNTFNGMDLGFIPLSFAVGRLDLNLGIGFKMTIDGDQDGKPDTYGLDIRKIEGTELFNLIGDGPMGRPLYINSNRNPLAAGLELLDWQQGLVMNMFYGVLGGTLLCGVEEGQNNTLSGTLGKAAVDLEKLVDYDKNLFRLSLAFNLLGIDLELDAALHALRGEIKFDSEGIHVRDVPIRVNPGPKLLKQIASEQTEGIIGSVSRIKSFDESPAQRNITDQFHNIGLLLSEDVINNALFGANLSGILNLNVDANFYAQNEFTPSSQLLPLGSMFLTQGLDVNLDGNTQNDSEVPVLIKIQSDVNQPPMLTFLSEEEVVYLNNKEIAYGAVEESGEDTSGGDSGEQNSESAEKTQTHFNLNERYFRLAVSGLEISVFEQEPKSSAGSQTYCNVSLPLDDNDILASKGLCQVATDAKTLIPIEKLSAGYECPENDLFNVPLGAGAIVSRPSLDEEINGDPVPIYRVRVGLMIHGKFGGINREIPAKDRLLAELEGTEPEYKNIFRIKLIPNIGFPEAYFTSVEVLENHTEKPNSQIVRNLEDLLSAAIGTDCSLFNEVKIPVPGEIEFDTESEGILSDFGLTSLDFGDTPEQALNVFIDDNRLYLDVLLYAGLNFSSEGGTEIDDQLDEATE